MGIDISRKLDFLMRLTNTQNRVLGKVLSFDASYISRIRTGKRGVPRNNDFIPLLSAYFARNIVLPHQKSALAKRICPHKEWPSSLKESANLLAHWLTDITHPMADDDFDIIDADIRTMTKNALSPKAIFDASPASFYYGNAGKREGVERFLSELCDMSSPPLLLLHSDENLTWMYEDENFVQRWIKLLMEFIAKGGKIKIIHTVRRNIEEMLEAIRKWMPLYTTGKIEAYYCPRIRDNIYRRTLFVAQNKSALVSHSIMDTEKSMVNIFLHDKGAVNALEDEFFDFLALCRPLIRIFHSGNIEDFLHTYAEFTKADDNLIMLRSIPSRCTMPESVNRSMAARISHTAFSQETSRLRTRFENHLLQGFRITEILCLKDPDTIADDTIPLPFCDLLGQPDLKYTRQEFRQHLEHLLACLKSQPNYHVILLPQRSFISHSVKALSEFDPIASPMENIMLMIKESTGVLMHNAGQATLALFSSESDITASFWDYLHRMTLGENRQETIRALKKYIDSLSD